MNHHGLAAEHRQELADTFTSVLLAPVEDKGVGSLCPIFGAIQYNNIDLMFTAEHGDDLLCQEQVSRPRQRRIFSVDECNVEPIHAVSPHAIQPCHGAWGRAA